MQLIASHIKKYLHYTDPVLISLWQKGDENAFDCLFERYVVYLTNIALKKTVCLDTARECVQEVFLSLHQRKHKLQTTSSLKAYLYVALQNKIYNYYQKELTRKQYEQTAGEQLKNVDNNLRWEYESKELEQLIHKKINQLPPQCRKVFLISRQDQLTYKEIAEQLKISFNTVDQHIQKALRILRNSMGEIMLMIIWMKIF